MKRIILAAILAIAGCGLLFSPQISGFLPDTITWSNWLNWSNQSGPITQAIVIEETATRTPVQANILYGKTAQALRSASKWKQFDKDHIPADYQSLIVKLPYRSVPWLYIDKGGFVKWNGELPTTEQAFSDLINRQGGIK